jgi:hypothetical protein
LPENKFEMYITHYSTVLSVQVPASETEVNVKELMKKCNETNPIDPGEFQHTSTGRG